MESQNYLIFVDWFQVSATRQSSQVLEEGMYIQGSQHTHDNKLLLYELTRPSEFNPIFDGCLGVSLHGFTLATIFFRPRPSQMRQNLCMVKMSNRILYSANWQWYLSDILAALRWQFLAVSRVDICCDFNYFAAGLAPVEFIRRYMHSGSVLDLTPSYIRVGSNKYSVIGRKVVRSRNVSGNSEDFCGHEHEYLRFGSRATGVCVYLYNKSRELSEKGHKQYIRDLWRKGSLSDTEDCPVYRLELSITTAATKVRRRLSAEEKVELGLNRGLYDKHLRDWSVSRLCRDDFGTQLAIENVFWAYASKYFRFKVVSSQKYTHNWPDLTLFEVDFTHNIQPYKISRSLDSGVAERNAASVLNRVLQQCRDLSLHQVVSVDETIKILQNLYHVRTKEADRDALESAIAALRAGHTWDEVSKMSILSIRQLQEFRQLVQEAVYKRLREVLTDPYVARAVDEWEAVRADDEELSNLYNLQTHE